MSDDRDDRIEGAQSYRFTVNQGWSRWLIEMDPKYGRGTADYSSFKRLEFALKSSDVKRWDAFDLIIESAGGKTYRVPLNAVGFQPDGKWHRCSVRLGDVANSGVDLTKITTLFAVAWEGGVRSGDVFKLDDLYLE